MSYPFAGRYFNKYKPFFPYKLLIASLLLLSSCKLSFGDISATYHKPAHINTGYRAFIFGDDYEYICTKSRIYKKNPSGNYSFEQSFIDGGVITFTYQKDNFLYVAVLYPKSADSIIFVLNRNYEIVSKIASDRKIESLVVYDDYLYCCEIYDSIHTLLTRYSLSTFKKDLLCKPFKDNDCYNDGSITLFLQFSRNTHYLQIIENGVFYSSYSYVYLYHKNFGLIYVKTDENRLCIEYNNIDIAVSKPYNKINFYDYAYIKDNYLIFAFYEFLENENCMPIDANDCICRYGQSCLLIIDLKNKEMINTFVYEHSSFLIDYDLTGSCYYFNGGLYNHGVLEKECETITNEGETTIEFGGFTNHNGTAWFVGKNDDQLCCFKYLDY